MAGVVVMLARLAVRAAGMGTVTVVAMVVPHHLCRGPGRCGAVAQHGRGCRTPQGQQHGQHDQEDEAKLFHAA